MKIYFMTGTHESSKGWGKRKLSDHEKRVRWFAVWVGTAMVLLVTGLILLISWLNTPRNLRW